jgi:hypothetical protein
MMAELDDLASTAPPKLVFVRIPRWLTDILRELAAEAGVESTDRLVEGIVTAWVCDHRLGTGPDAEADAAVEPKPLKPTQPSLHNGGEYTNLRRL